jgi:transposase
MTSATTGETRITAGIDTHRDTHTAAALDALGRALGTETFPAKPEGYIALVSWLRGFGSIDRIGIEGTGSYGAGLARHLRGEGIVVLEVGRPNRQARRRRGKSDPADAEAAARATHGRGDSDSTFAKTLGNRGADPGG